MQIKLLSEIALVVSALSFVFPKEFHFRSNKARKKGVVSLSLTKGRQKRYKNNDGHISLGGEPSGM